ncbi:hypothetical protein K469DRAFT_38253 [Zopfia rhizophila CBS 207.26]|uniref:Rhodopsin domain-containing protein n=1 Tax=Zopfia rhizophila CBS 207.26 TaxID=1314779 RepID=A0A6A6DAD8_9PEZI|nr:hypothetical protein K469DRAFT_38253 [Zopfia rhizophila CBS 207.26]
MAKKIGVAAMFSTGFICCVASSLSVYFQHRIYENQTDFTYYVVFVYLTYTLEMCAGISTSCMQSLARLHRDKTGAKFNSIVSSLWFPFRSLCKSTNASSHTGSKASTLEGYPKGSPYAFMGDDSILGSQSHEMSHVESEPTPAANQHLGRPLPHDRIHFSVDISQHHQGGQSVVSPQ